MIKKSFAVLSMILFIWSLCTGCDLLDDLFGSNSQPVANAGNNQTVTIGDIVQLDGGGSSDPDGDTLTYSWSFISKPSESSAVLSKSNTENATFTADKDGDYITKLVVNDGKLDANSDEVTITAEAENLHYTVRGYVQKGPFISGSSITIPELDSELIPTGDILQTTTVDDFGSFILERSIDAIYVEIIATGFYFNEVTGTLSNANITLRALANLESGGNVNINLLTTLEKDRIIHLIRNEDKSFQQAKEQAETEILSIFNISIQDGTTFEDMDISRDGSSNAILLAASAIMQVDNTEAELSEMISQINLDIKGDGILNSTILNDEIKNNSTLVYINQIRENLLNRYSSLGHPVTVPAFQAYIDSDGNGVLNKDQFIDENYVFTSSGMSYDLHQPDYIEKDGVIYCAFPDQKQNNNITVIKFENGNWDNLNIGLTLDARYPQIEIDSNGIIYTTFYQQVTEGANYTDYAGILFCYKYEANTWIKILEENIQNHFSDLITGVDGNDNLYVVYGVKDSNYADLLVKKYSSTWDQVDPSIIYPKFSGDPSVAFDGQNHLFIAYRTFGSGHGIAVLEYDSNIWTQKGSIIGGGLAYPNLLYSNSNILLFSYTNGSFRKHEYLSNDWVEETISIDFRSQFAVAEISNNIYISSIEFGTIFGTLPAIYLFENSNLNKIDLSYLGYIGKNGPEGYWLKTNLLSYGVNSQIVLYPTSDWIISGVVLAIQ